MSRSPYMNSWRIVLLWTLILVSCGCRPGAERLSAAPPFELTLAVFPAPYSGLIAVADEKGYFREEGLDVSLALHPSGREALEAVIRGEAEVATTADVAFAVKALREPSIRVLASIGTSIGSQIVARRDRKIRMPSDLKGKVIGYTPNTISDYFLYAFLLTENIPPDKVRVVKIPAGRQAEAVVNGDVDAVSAFEGFAYEAKGRLGENGVYWDSQNNLAYKWLLASTERVIASPEPLKRLLKALLKAEEFARADEEETRRIVARKWGFDPEFLRHCWPRTRLHVFFSQTIVTSLQMYSRWEMRTRGKSGDPPDVMTWLHPGILDEVAPKTVTLFR